MTRICPKCSYARKPTDDAPEWQCPSCQVAYIKASGEPAPANYGRYGAPAARNKSSSFGATAMKGAILVALLGAGFWLGKPLWEGRKGTNSVVLSAAAQPAVTLYATEWCGYCAATRELFDANGIKYVELDVEKSTAGYEGHRKLGGNGVPLIVVGDEVIHGYNEARLRNTLKPWMKM